MSKKLYVGGLSWGTTDESLRRAFEPYGQVTEAKVVLDRETGRSRGFGFVTFANDDHAMAAISGLNGTDLDGRAIKVSEAEDRGPRTGGGGGRFGGGGGGRPSGGGFGGGRGGRGGRDNW